MPKRYGNVLTLLLTWSLSATNTTTHIVFQKITSPALYHQPPTTPNVVCKQSANSYTANPPPGYRPRLQALYLQTTLNRFWRQNIQTFLPPATLLHHLRTFSCCYPRWCLSFHSCLKHRNSPDPVQLSNQAISLRSHFHMASQRMFIGTCFHNQQYCLPLSNFRQFHPTLKESVISPLLTKPTLYIYRPISKLSLISKIIERVVKSRHMDQFTQFSPVKHYCRKTAFLHPRSPR